MVVHLDGGPGSTDGADTALSRHKSRHFLGANPVLLPQPVMAMTAIQALDGFFVPGVMAGLAVGRPPVAGVFVPTEGVEGLYLAAVWAPPPGLLEAFAIIEEPIHRTSVR